MHWKLDDLRKGVGKKRIGRRYSEFEESLSSFARRHNIASYHASEARGLLEKSLPKESIQRVIKLFGALLAPSDSESNKDVALAYFYTEAHIYAYAQALHAASDILAKVVWRALDLDVGWSKKKWVNLPTLLKEVQKGSDIHTSIDDLINNKPYGYLSAFTNQIKHHSVVPTSIPMQYWEDSGEWVGLELSDFRYSGEYFPTKLLKEFVTDDFDAVSARYLAIIHGLIVAL